METFIMLSSEPASKRLIHRTLINALVAAGLVATPVTLLAQGIKLPSTITVTAYDTGSSGFNMGVAVGKMLKDKQGSDVRVLPAGNDVARLAPLKANRAQASFMGVGVTLLKKVFWNLRAVNGVLKRFD